jgi:hypothetical protein
MSTANSIKLKLKNNVKNRLLTSLNAKVTALADTASCNDYFASCCNCCKTCDCCPCLDGLWIQITGVASLECNCTQFNSRVYVPRLNNFPNDRVPAEVADLLSDSTCTASGWQLHNLGVYDCGIFTVPLEVSWLLFCTSTGDLVLVIDARTVETNAAESANMHWIFYPTDCNDLFQFGPTICNDGVVFEEYCDCSNAFVQTEPVFGGPNTDPECQCCNDVRCEEADPGCTNPFPETLILNLTDNCSGEINDIVLTRNAMCWEGSYTTNCEECETPKQYTVDASLCCNGGIWTFIINVVDPDTCTSFCWSTYPNLDLEEGCVRMDNVTCDPISASSNLPNQTDCDWYNCPPQSGPYRVISWNITEAI